MAEIYNRIDTDMYFDKQSIAPILEYVNSDIITDFENKSVIHGLTEIWLCRSGTGEMTIESVRRRVREGDFWVMNPYTLHSAYARHGETTEYLILGIRNVKFDIPDDLSKSWFTPTDNRLRTYIEFIYREAKKPEKNTVQVMSKLLDLVLLETQRYFDTDVLPYNKKESYKLTDSVASYIETHFNQQISIDELTKIFYCAKSTLIHSFKKARGVSIMEYAMQCRLKEAQLWLRKSDMSVSNIALNCGFSSMPYFYKYFSKNVGMSPTDYRKKFTENAEQND